MSKLFTYSGTPSIAKIHSNSPMGFWVQKAEDFITWTQQNQQKPERDLIFRATYVLDTLGKFLIADRHSEHVACAGGQSVLAEGEVGFTIQKKSVVIEEISNYSTGYCPDVLCFAEVQKTLNQINVLHPNWWTREAVFRRCLNCKEKNLVKDSWFYCLICYAPLTENWNL